MKIRINKTAVYCLLGGDYEKVYRPLSQLTGDCQGLFTERVPGNDYLQWNLPGDGWNALSSCDPLTASMVQKQLDERLQQVRQRFGSNTDMANMVLSVPSNDYIFYRDEPDGKLSIALTAWGYRYPARVDVGDMQGDGRRPTDKEKVQIAFDWDGEHSPDVPFKLKDQLQRTDKSGLFNIKDEIEVGNVIPIVVAEKELSITVTKGQQLYSFDLTKRFDIEVTVTRDGKPAANTACKVIFRNKTLEVITDDSGHASQSIAFAPDQGKVAMQQPECTVKCEAQSQSLTPSIENDKLQFNLQLVTRMLDIDVVVTRDDKPVSHTPVKVEFGDKTLELTTDDNGHAIHSMPLVLNQQSLIAIPQPECKVSCEDQSQALTPSSENDKLQFNLQLVTRQLAIDVAVTRDGKPAANTPVKVEFGDKTLELTTDINGHATQSMLLMTDQQGMVITPQPECKVTCEDQSQSLTPSPENNKLQFTITLVTVPKFLSLCFLDCKGKPMSQVEIHVVNKAGKKLVATTDEAGKVSFPREEFQNGEKPKIEFVISKEYQQKNPGTYR